MHCCSNWTKNSFPIIYELTEQWQPHGCMRTVMCITHTNERWTIKSVVCNGFRLNDLEPSIVNNYSTHDDASKRYVLSLFSYVPHPHTHNYPLASHMYMHGYEGQLARQERMTYILIWTLYTFSAQWAPLALRAEMMLVQLLLIYYRVVLWYDLWMGPCLHCRLSVSQ